MEIILIMVLFLAFLFFWSGTANRQPTQPTVVVIEQSAGNSGGCLELLAVAMVITLLLLFLSKL